MKGYLWQQNPSRYGSLGECYHGGGGELIPFLRLQMNHHQATQILRLSLSAEASGLAIAVELIVISVGLSEIVQLKLRVELISIIALLD